MQHANIIYRAQSVYRRAVGWAARVQFPAVKDYSLLHGVQTDSGSHPASYPLDTGIKRPRREADHSPPASVEVKKMWIYTSTLPHRSSWHIA
jgi:hypothetical protein